MFGFGLNIHYNSAILLLEVDFETVSDTFSSSSHLSKLYFFCSFYNAETFGRACNAA